MKGTEKQIAWAEKIKKALVTKFQSLENEFGPAPEIVKQYMDTELAHEEAKYFIDHWRFVTTAGFDLTKVFSEDCSDEIGDAAFEWEIKVEL